MTVWECRSCPECGGELDGSAGETVCRTCGLVVDGTAIDRGPQWRSRSDGEQTRRTGPPRSRDRHDRGLSTEIGFGTGSDVSEGSSRQLVRMRRHHKRARLSSKAERNQVYTYGEIRRLVAVLDLPASVREQACALFDSAQSGDLLRGRSLEGFAAATVYAVCRVQSISRTMDEIVDPARCDRSELQCAYDALNRTLGLPVGPIDPAEYIPRFATKLDLDSEVERLAREYATRLLESGAMGGRNPSGVAGACLYKAAAERNAELTQSRAAEVAEVSRMTIRSTVALLSSTMEPAATAD